MTEIDKPMDVTVRAQTDGEIQVAIYDPDLPYGNRPCEIVLVTPQTAANLIAGLSRALAKQLRGDFDY